MPVDIRRAEQSGLEEPADEFRLTAGSGFRENALCVRTCCRLGNFKLRCGGEKPIARNKFHAVNLVEFQTDPLPSARPG